MMENPEFSACYLVAGINCLKIARSHWVRKYMFLRVCENDMKIRNNDIHKVKYFSCYFMSLSHKKFGLFWCQIVNYECLTLRPPVFIFWPIFHIMHRWMALKFFVFHRIYCIIIKSFFCAVVFFGLGFMVLFQIQHTNKQKVSMTKTVASV